MGWSQMERLEFAVQADVADLRVRQSMERLDRLISADRAGWTPDDYQRVQDAATEMRRLVDVAAEANAKVAERLRGTGLNTIEWVGCSAETYERAVAQRLAAEQSRS